MTYSGYNFGHYYGIHRTLFSTTFLWNTLYRQPSKHESSVSSFNFSQKSVISSGFVKNNRTKLKQVSFWSYCHMSSTLLSVFFIILFSCIHDTEIKTQHIYFQNPSRVRHFFSDCHFQNLFLYAYPFIAQNIHVYSKINSHIQAKREIKIQICRYH